MDGQTALGTATLTSGTAVFPVPVNLSTTTHSITAVYSGDTDFTTSTSPAVTETVKQDGSITTVKSSTNPSTFGGSTTLSATVTADHLGSATPTGSVTFKNGSTSLGTVQLSGGSASLPISTLPGGNDSITAVYNGDTNFTGGSSLAISQTVNAQGTMTMLSIPSGGQTVFGQSVTFDVTVSPDTAGGLAPGGTVTLSLAAGSPGGAEALGTFPVTGGSATIPVALHDLGTLQVEAVYNGDGNYAPSDSTDVSQTVVQDGSSAAVTTSGSPSALDVPVVLTARVNALAPGSGTPTGQVTFMDGTSPLGTKTLTGGTATLTTTFAGGGHSITVMYGGDSNFITITSPSVTQTVEQVGSHTALVTSATQAVFGQLLSFTATVTPGSGLGTPDGSVTFMSGSTALATVPLSGGSAVFTTSSLPLGNTTVTAAFSGSASFAQSTSSSVTENVASAATVVTLVPSSNPGFVGKAVTITVTVSSASPGALTPDGVITFKLGKKKLGTATLSNGTAALSTKKLRSAATRSPSSTAATPTSREARPRRSGK